MRPSTTSIRWISLGLLLCFWGTRILSLNSFPPFLDEAYHISYAEDIVRTGGLFANASDGRIGTVWLHYAFASYATASAFWIGRIVTILMMMIGLASVLAIARTMAGWRALLLVGVFLVFNNYLMFFNRLALADPPMATFVLLAIYFSYRLTKRIVYRDAVIVGVLLFLGILAKVSALPYLGVPLAAGLCLHSKGFIWRKQVIWTAIALAVGGGLTLVMNFFLASRGYTMFGHLVTGNAGASASFLQDLLSPVQSNGTLTLSVFSYYLPPLAFILFLVAFLILALKRRFFLPLILFAPLLVSLLSSWYATRNLMLSIFLLVLGGAVVLANSLEAQLRGIQSTIIGIVTLIFVAYWALFTGALITNPANAPLFERDHVEYVSADSSGFGLDEVVARLETLNPERVIGILPNCYALRYMTLGHLPIECPTLNPDGSSIGDVFDLIQSSRADGTYALLETNSYTPSSLAGELIDTISHESTRPDIKIYDLKP